MGQTNEEGAESWDRDLWVDSKFFPGIYKCMFPPFSVRKALRSRQVQFHAVKGNPRHAFFQRGTWGQDTHPEFTDAPGNLE